jgi:hypothetical protein
VDGVLERIVANAGRPRRLGVGWADRLRLERELAEERERRTKSLVDRSRVEIVEDCADDLGPERIRRDRAVGLRSERTLVLGGHERGEELTLSGRPL